MAKIIVRSIVKPKRIKPIYVMNARHVTGYEKDAVLAGVETVLKAANMDLEIKDFGYWNQGNKDYESVDWYIKNSLMARNRGYGQQLDGTKILDLFLTEPWQAKEPHYDVFVVDHDLYSHGTDFVIGLARLSCGAVLSAKRFRNLDLYTGYECIKSETIHELGHVFGAARGRRGTDVLTGADNGSDLYNSHCANQCSMQQGNVVPTAWIKLSENRISRNKAFCKQCENEIKRYFRKDL